METRLLASHGDKKRMKKKKIMLVFGTRPEAIKMAPVYLMLKRFPDEFDVQLCITAQHRSMLDQVLDVFKIIPDIDLNIMKPGQDLFDLTTAVLSEMKAVIKEFTPDLVMVHGDTTTSLAAAMAAYYLNVKIGHIEAGLRTNNIYSPFPEEFNRQVVSKISNWHFAPTNQSRENLLIEKIPEDTIFVTGNTVIDSLNLALQQINSEVVRERRVSTILDENLNFSWKDSPFILITGHRRENFGSGFVDICNAIKGLAIQYPHLHFVYPVHLNPNVQGPVFQILGGLPNVHLIAPLDYEPFIYLLKHCYIVLTDSGGIQEEAPNLGKPVLVMRDNTERPEAVAAGTVKLVGAGLERILKEVSNLIDDPILYKKMALSHNPYGDGRACEAILVALRELKL
jgi:UDP-N-acetylglucosamine 2-epimerase (non-hydrolysing)